MTFNLGVGDVIAVTTLAWTLYHDCWKVVQNAPEDFRLLVNELACLQNVLRDIRDDVTSNKDYLENLGEQRRESLRRCFAGCFDALKQVENLVIKYREIGNKDHKNIWTRVKWTTHQSEIKDLRNRVMAYSTNLNLCISRMGNSSLQRLERQISEALKVQEAAAAVAASATAKDDTAAIVPAEGVNLRGPTDRGNNTAARHGDQSPEGRVQRSSTEATIGNSALLPSPPSSPPLSDAGRELEPTPTSRRRSSSSSRTPIPSPKQFGESQSFSEAVCETPPSVVSDTPDLLQAEKPIVNVIADALRQLSLVRRADKSARPLRYPRRDELHIPDDELKSFFAEIAKEEVQYRLPNARDWLQVATWWLLKARNKMELHEPLRNSPSPGSDGVSRNSTSMFTQAYVDLLKVSWILYDVFLPNERLASRLTEENRKLFHDCSRGLSDDFLRLKEADIPNTEEIHKQNLNIWEEVQSEETSEDDDFMLGLDHGRWITVEPAGAGEDDEKVLFRTFVDGMIGRRKRAVTARGWPYLLILSSKEGESEPKVTLCNQSGTLGVTRVFTSSDLVDPECPVKSSAVGTELFDLNFGELKVKVSFSSSEDLARFMAIPKNYFDAVSERDPRELSNATETLIFRSPVQTFEVLKADTMRPTNPKEHHSSCDLRILETTEKEGWRIVRRLVLSSSVGHPNPWSKSYFLPLSRVQLHTEDGSRRVKLKWSDCSQARQERIRRDDRSISVRYTYGYTESSPNLGVEVSFRTQAELKSFEDAILSPSFQPQYTWSTGSDKNHVYMIEDSDEKKYKGLLIQRTKTKLKYSEFYFFYRDIDYAYSQTDLTVWLPQLYYINYISLQAEVATESNNPGEFSHCEKKVGNCTIQFDTEETSHGFMSAISGNHTLLFSRRANYIQKPSRFGRDEWQARGQAEVQLWRTNLGFRLLSRWPDRKGRDCWVTLSLPESGIDTPQKDSNLLVLPTCEWKRGRKLNLAKLEAEEPKDPKDAGHFKSPMTISFASYKDQELFLRKVLNGPPPVEQRGPLFDFL